MTEKLKQIKKKRKRKNRKKKKKKRKKSATPSFISRCLLFTPVKKETQ